MIVVADSSVFLNLSFRGQESLLTPLLETVHAPPQVEVEFLPLAATDPRFHGLVFPTFILILTLTPIYDFLKGRGHAPDGDSISICGWPVQFLPAESPLLEEAVQKAVAVDFEGVPTRVMTAEHLAVIALQTGRAKDYTRLLAFVESGALEAEVLSRILARHQLSDAWSRFEAKFLHP